MDASGQRGLYHPSQEHDSCGVGFVVNMHGVRDHKTVSDGITILCNLEHRGARGGDQKTGDGAGMLVQIPHRFFSRVAGCVLPAEGEYGVGFFFLAPEIDRAAAARALVEQTLATEGVSVLGWREVPTSPDCLGEFARDVMPSFWQVFVAADGVTGEVLERKLYVARKCVENAALKQGWEWEQLYASSFSSRTIVYKGMFVAPQFATFYPDLTDPDFVSCFSLVHQRYSTNTFPSWPLAQPFRFVAHNGEINTLRRNVNNMRARQTSLRSELFGDEIRKLLPVVYEKGSDSSVFDNVFELLVMGGRQVEHAGMMMVPEAFGSKYHISQDKRAFFEYHSAIMEPWDGPAAIAFADGTRVGAMLDRNGLRPARYVVTKDDRVVLASEVGVLDIPPGDIKEKGRLAPGRMILVDTQRGRLLRDTEIKAAVSRWKPYRRWLEENRIELRGLLQPPTPVEAAVHTLAVRQRLFGYTLEDLKMLIAPMVSTAQEPVGSMGNDAAPAVLSDRPQLLYNYFKQLFAQVTNPPIDPYRENLVMSLMSYVGREQNILDETPQHCRQLKLAHPVLTNDDVERLLNSTVDGLKVCRVAILCAVGESLAQALERVAVEVERRVDEDHALVVLSDRHVDETHMAIPALLAMAAVHHHLVRAGKRHLSGLVLETGEAREVHHFATLIGYGASGINPYLVFETIDDLQERGYIPADLTIETAIENYIAAVKKGLLKVMSKMGISTIRSYRGSQTYEAVGLDRHFVDTYFAGTTSHIGGIGIEVLERETRMRHEAAMRTASEDTRARLESGGYYHFRRGGEKHRLTPEAVALLQRAVRTGSYETFKEYSRAVSDSNHNLCTLRGLFRFRPGRPVPVDEVEPVESIVKRFVTSAMSFGSISKEAHETLAIGMNRLGAQSNSGEGGEDEARYQPRANGDDAMSKVKQVASARFGVNSLYLAKSQELQIKMAQGAKPGEGGQLPGHKVDETIARVRHSTPGVMLISPPPHHDIYSIEDLAQLIFDLKNANPRARVSVKLVSEVGVGTVAAGVAKGKADMVLISGGDGGTGASPVSSIKHAGTYWEVGLAEAQQVLVRNKLRECIRVQTDGQMRTGRDVTIAALLGAEEFGFGTISLVSIGCIMMRKCHLNNCPVGVATQNPELRKRFAGKPEHIANFMRFIAQETREYMAELGFRTVADMVGHVEMLEVSDAIEHYKAKGLDFSRVFARPEIPEGGQLRCTRSQEMDWSMSLDPELVREALPAIERKQKVRLERPIRNCNRTVGATLSYEVSMRHGSAGLPEDTIRVKFAGSAGQSFGAFLAPGITLELEGDANDYFGKGLSGGRLIVYPPKESTFLPHRNSIVGNVNLFGATSGEVFINGVAGERFAVRNSGATAVVEGVGDHGCEYMTGGRVVILGDTGVNFAAGMSGGIAYVLDQSQLFDTRCNLEMVDVEPVTDRRDVSFLRAHIDRHVKYTGSPLGKRILNQWEEMLPLFVRVMPIDYRRALERMATQNYRGTDLEAVTEEVFG